MLPVGKIEELKGNTFDHDWEIKNWRNVLKNENLIVNTKTKINCSADSLVYAEFMIGLKLHDHTAEHPGVIGFYLKQLCKHYKLDNKKFNLDVGILSNAGTESISRTIQNCAENGKEIDMIKNFWRFGSISQLTNWTNYQGSLIIQLKFTINDITGNEVCYSKTEEFRRICTNDLCQNLAALMDNSLCSDLKIITNDNNEHFAHKIILCGESSRCPVFTSMFRSEFLESSTGVLHLDDISGKTMKVLLKYWYTGELLPFWKDDDIIVEFTYAAGKYQTDYLLKMLDRSIGSDFKASDVDVELLKLVHQLSLWNAEARLLTIVVDKINQAKNKSELLNLFSLTTDKVDEGNFTILNVLKAFDHVLAEDSDKKACPSDIKLMVFASQNDFKNVENKLLHRIIGTVDKINSADELLALFDLNHDKTDQSSNSRNLLVRATPIVS